VKTSGKRTRREKQKKAKERNRLGVFLLLREILWEAGTANELTGGKERKGGKKGEGH